MRLTTEQLVFIIGVSKNAGDTKMLAVIVNALGIAVGTVLGVLFRERISQKLVDALMVAMGLVVIVIGVQSTVGTDNTLCIVLSLAFGAMIGEVLHVDRGLDGIGDKVRSKLAGKKFAEGRFVEGMITASILFAVGTMSILGSIEAGVSKDYSILFTKTVMDTISSAALTAALGIGVGFSLIPVFIWEGLIALLAGILSPLFSTEVIAAMSAVGGAIFIAMGFNMTNVTDRKINVANLIPAIFIPLIYVPLANWISGLI